MTVYEQFSARIRETDTMRELIRSLDEEPARLLQRICSRYQETGRPVADHYLQLTGYFGEAMLRVLVKAHYIDRVPGGRGALNAYEPTADGLEVFHHILKENGS
ncbi:MAG: hypothetical protein GX600_02585 [Dehalococcoidia bacterium]|nr:hypothetical protein [Dehalococcoidia bacterium]